ncbi:MAG: ATP-binding cassette domain-containing protein, partial [Verrucomicrobia bacterium]|nr:ATP-binding cassette domain-containing protein [Verrucomicrobiota bacterium]
MQPIPPMLEMRGICKTFGTVRANRNIDLTVERGRIVGLLGENGSGKSTLMKVLFGMVRPDAGTVSFNGHALQSHSPGDAIRAGICMIHQHFMLVEAMTVLENVMLGWSRAGTILKSIEIAKLIRTASKEYGLELSPKTRVSELGFGKRQRIEIVKAILRGAQLLILDEPTSNLSPVEVSSLFQVMRAFAAQGRSVVFISHKMGEVLDLCDEVVVLRAGEVTHRGPVQNATRADLARLMVGREIRLSHVSETKVRGSELMTIEGLTLIESRPPIDGLSLSLRSGEIFALAGVDGNGQLELIETIAGLRRASKGKIILNGREITPLRPEARVAAGVAYIPVDRANTSLVPDMTVQDNLAFRDFNRPPLRKGIWLDKNAFLTRARTRIQQYQIACPGPQVAAQTLSGGN